MCCTNFYYGKKAKALRLQLSTCFYYLAPFCVKVKGDDGIYPNPPSLIPFTKQYHAQYNFGQGHCGCTQIREPH